MKMADTYQKDTESFAFGTYKGTLYRRADLSKSSWFFRIYLKEEGRHFRKSLKTDDVRVARELAMKELIQVLAKVQSGQRILAVSLADLRRRFSLHQQALVDQGQLSKNTLDNHGTRLNHGVRFLKQNGKDLQTRVSSLDGEIWNGYLEWRFADAHSRRKTIRRDVVRDELLTIRQMFTYANKEKLCTEKVIPKWSFEVEKQGPKRQRMTQRNYVDFLTCIYHWIKEAKNDRERYNRLLLRHFVLVVSNSGMRSGELFGLKNKYVTVRPKANECLINIRAATSKVRQDRQISFHASYGGNVKRTERTNYLIRWLSEFQIFKEPDHYVFSTMDDGKQDARDVYYHNYKLLRVRLKELGIGWFDTYHCRHFWITNRLLAGEPIHLVARAAGTSVAEIESTYSHVLGEMATKQFSKRQVQYDDEGGFIVVTTPDIDQSTKKRTRKTEV
jgi:site-specific recombinase XerD